MPRFRFAVMSALAQKGKRKAFEFSEHLLEGPVKVGREKDSHLQVLDPSVSRQHGQFYLAGGKLWYKDMSKNGTLILPNRFPALEQLVKKDEETEINDKDAIAFGGKQAKEIFRIRFVRREQGATEPPRPPRGEKTAVQKTAVQRPEEPRR